MPQGTQALFVDCKSVAESISVILTFQIRRKLSPTQLFSIYLEKEAFPSSFFLHLIDYCVTWPLLTPKETGN